MINIIGEWEFVPGEDTVYVKEVVGEQYYIINEESSKRLKNRRLKTIEAIEGLGLLFDGYSIWAQGDLKFDQTMPAITLSTWILPRSYELELSAIISQCNIPKKEGFVLGVGKHGTISFQFGNGQEWYVLGSNNHVLKRNQWNCLTVVLDGEVGWMFLYLNGIEINRKQIPRKTNLKRADVECILGKHNHAIELTEDFRLNVLDGFLNQTQLISGALTKDQVYDFYRKSLEKHGGHIPFVKEEHIALSRKDYSNDIQRPQFHLIAPGHWMNEPHAPIYFEGKYHIFYQANPHAPIWNNIQWGHMISDDMVHWEDVRGLALETENNGLDPDGCWSGSCCYDEKGIPAIFYTAGNNNKCPNQMIALATSNYLETGDITLQKWIKHSKPLLEQSKEIGWHGEFRDPFVWKEDNTWYMLVGTGDSDYGGGNAVLYTSRDMYNWTYRSFIIDYDYTLCEEVGHMWELPVLLPLRNKQGEIKKHILLLCACRIENEVVETYYWTGKWDKANYKFIPEHKLPKLVDLGKGTFTGASGFVTPDKRSVVFTISQGKRTPRDEYEAGWAHNGGLPVELFLYDDESIGIKPIEELQRVRKNKLIDLEKVTLEEANKVLDLISGNMFEIQVEASVDYLGIDVEYAPDKKIEVYYDKKQTVYGARDNGIEIGRLRGDIDKVDIQGHTISIHFYLDHSMIESYLNERKSMTLRNYAEIEKRRLSLNGASNITIDKLQVWELQGIYKCLQ